MKDRTSETELLAQRNQELYTAYIKKSRDLNQVYKSLSQANARLTVMVTEKFCEVLNERRLLALSEAFDAIAERKNDLYT